MLLFGTADSSNKKNKNVSVKSDDTIDDIILIVLFKYTKDIKIIESRKVLCNKTYRFLITEFLKSQNL